MLHNNYVFPGYRAMKILVLGFVLTAGVSSAHAAGPFEVAPINPQPAGAKPGLAVEYLYQKFYSLAEIYEADVDPVQGDPIPQLDQLTETDPATGEDKILNVLTSDQDMMVGAFIRGAIKFDQVGTYTLYIVSNDGVRLWVDDVMLWEDPEIHFDRESDPLEVVVKEPGWHALKIDYYQKKGTSALQLLWTPPGSDKKVVVPSIALAHFK